MKRLLLSFLLVAGTSTTHAMAVEAPLDSGKSTCVGVSGKPPAPATKTLLPANIFGLLNCGSEPLLAFVLAEEYSVEKFWTVTLDTPLMPGGLIPVGLGNSELADCVAEVTFFFPTHKSSVPGVNFCFKNLGLLAQ